jgi:hypothetical protein
MDSALPGAEPPTLFTRMSSRPKAATAASMAAFTASLSVTSAVWATARLPSLR